MEGGNSKVTQLYTPLPKWEPRNDWWLCKRDGGGKRIAESRKNISGSEDVFCGKSMKCEKSGRNCQRQTKSYLFSHAVSCGLDEREQETLEFLCVLGNNQASRQAHVPPLETKSGKQVNGWLVWYRSEGEKEWVNKGARGLTTSHTQVV